MKQGKFWLKLLFGMYAAWMLWLLFGQRLGMMGSDPYWQQLRENSNLRPLETVGRYLWVLRHSTSTAQIRHAIINLVGNVIMFVPLGFLTPCLWQRLRKFGWHCLAMLLTILTVELLQLLTLLGSCDVDDLLLNLVGTSIGYLLWKLWQKIRK